jgi:anti-anti-sigma factor
MELTGRIESSNADEWKEKINSAIPENGDMIFECSDLTYISSAGIRIIINTYKLLKKRRNTVIMKNVSPAVMEVLDLTGVSDFVNIE